MDERADYDLQERLTAWRRHLHAHPELSRHEASTADFVGERLAELGIPFTKDIGGHGLVATLKRGSSNRSVGLRADMDALPITEMTGAPYASTAPGVMHACGHDGHTTSLLGAAMLLQDAQDWTGTVHLVFQPAEEGSGGAKAMVADGLFDRFPMERMFGYHNWPGLAAGTVAVHDGPVMAAGARISVVVRGHAGHAAMPHLTRDPVLAAAHLVVGLQSIVARSVDPLDTAVVSICMVQGGSAPNQIPDSVVLQGTFRTHRLAVQELVEQRVRGVAAGVERMCGVDIDVELTIGVTSTTNTGPEADLAAAAASDSGLVLRRDLAPSMAGEDFGWYLRDRPGAFAWIGNGVDSPALHSASYDFNDAILPAAARWLANVARGALSA